MTDEHPPRLASWLMKRFASCDKRESLIGDLDEQFAHGRSSWWYRRQVAAAILAGVVEEVGHHPVLTARALLVGWALRWVGKSFAESLETPGRFVSVQIGTWLFDHGHESLRFWWFRSNLYNLPRWTMWWIVTAGIGWTIAYTHRSRRSPLLVVLFALSVLAAVSPWIASNLERDAWGFVAAVVPALIGFATTVAGGLLGGDSPSDVQTRVATD